MTVSLNEAAQLNPDSQCAGGDKTALPLLGTNYNYNRRRAFLPCLKARGLQPEDLMKLQRHLILLFAAFFVGLWIAPIHQALAQKERPDKTEQKGRIRFDLPNAPEPKVEVNLTR